MTATTAPEHTTSEIAAAKAAAELLTAAGLPHTTHWDFRPAGPAGQHATAEGHLPQGSTALTLRRFAGVLHGATWSAGGSQVTGTLGRVPVTLRVAA
jgi:hypothetical protein